MFGFIETNLKSQSGENIAAKMTHGSAREDGNHMKNGYEQLSRITILSI